MVISQRGPAPTQVGSFVEWGPGVMGFPDPALGSHDHWLHHVLPQSGQIGACGGARSLCYYCRYRIHTELLGRDARCSSSANGGRRVSLVSLLHSGLKTAMTLQSFSTPRNGVSHWHCGIMPLVPHRIRSRDVLNVIQPIELLTSDVRHTVGKTW